MTVVHISTMHNFAMCIFACFYAPCEFSCTLRERVKEGRSRGDGRSGAGIVERVKRTSICERLKEGKG